MPSIRVPLLFALCLAVGLAALAAGCSDDDGEKPPECVADTLLPADGAVGDLKASGTAKTALNKKALEDLINGGSEKYTANRFACLALLTYTSAAKGYKDFEVRLFDQTDAAGAQAAYKASAPVGAVDISPTIGDASREDVNTVARVYTGGMRKGKYVARVQAEDAADPNNAKADVQAMLKAIAAAIK
jgi:hypothetical protein